MKSILECWAILESCLSSPTTDLPRGATPDAIAEYEATTGVALAEPLREFYLAHDGTGDCYFGPYEIGGGDQGVLSLQQSQGNWQAMCQIGEEMEGSSEFGEQEGPIRKNYWNKKWLPLTDNGCGDYIYIDYDPATDGSIGQVVDWWHEPAKSTFIQRDFSEFFGTIAEKVREGKYNFRLIG